MHLEIGFPLNDSGVSAHCGKRAMASDLKLNGLVRPMRRHTINRIDLIVKRKWYGRSSFVHELPFVFCSVQFDPSPRNADVYSYFSQALIKWDVEDMATAYTRLARYFIATHMVDCNHVIDSR